MQRYDSRDDRSEIICFNKLRGGDEVASPTPPYSTLEGIVCTRTLEYSTLIWELFVCILLLVPYYSSRVLVVLYPRGKFRTGAESRLPIKQVCIF